MRYALRVCVALLHDHRTAAPVSVVPVCRCRVSVIAKPVAGTPPPFFGGACVSGVYCRPCVLVAVLVSCVLVAGHAVRVSVACIYPYQWALRAVCGLYGYYVICYPLPSYMPPICVYIAQAPALDHVQRERLCYVMRLCVRSCVRLCVRAMRADILPRRCQ